VKLTNRVGALALATALGTAGLALPYAAPAGAALKPTVACAKVDAPALKGSTKLKSTFASCTPALLAAGGTSLTKVDTSGPTSGKLTMTITWKNGKGTTKATVAYAPTTQGKCKAPRKRVKITGKVVSSTGAAKIVKAGEPLSGFVCSVQSGPNVGLTSIEPGTKFKL
jgi:hypothetical protein